MHVSTKIPMFIGDTTNNYIITCTTSPDHGLYTIKPRIEKIISNGGATIVFWKDGDKTVIKQGQFEIEDIEKAILWAYFYKNEGLSKKKGKTLFAKFMKKIIKQ